MLTPFVDISDNVFMLRLEMEDSFKLLNIFRDAMDDIRNHTSENPGETMTKKLDRYVLFSYEFERLAPILNIFQDRMKEHADTLGRIGEALGAAMSENVKKTT